MPATGGQRRPTGPPGRRTRREDASTAVERGRRGVEQWRYGGQTYESLTEKGGEVIRHDRSPQLIKCRKDKR
ncbi:unnamed protein product [Prunus armeniaca]|uniref:Uncharacterized protein n=1 Tax=Prunus armeniaca TaxID=36596 RepID=A0A6J5Y6S7_PRUAR|nr:unnamed protein product [Prunus armeniaca]